MEKVQVEDLQPEEQWTIGGFIFQTWQQSSYPREEYSVKCIRADGDSFWLKWPERRFETVSGARMAILGYLEEQE